MNSLFKVSFLDPELLWFLAPLMALYFVVRRRSPNQVYLTTFALAQQNALADSGQKIVRQVVWHLPYLSLALLIFAMARPVLVVTEEREFRGIDIMLCQDLSSSMAAEESLSGRNRLDVVKNAALKFVEARENDRIGLVSFARYPDLKCPPTRDHVALAEFLRSLELLTKEDQEDATGIGTAIARAAAILNNSATHSPVIVLLTDGEENVATKHLPDEIRPQDAAEYCQQLGIKLYLITMGATDRVESLESQAIRKAVEATGGRAFVAQGADRARAIYREIDALEPHPLLEEKDRLVPKSQLLILIGGFFMCVSRWLLHFPLRGVC